MNLRCDPAQLDAEDAAVRAAVAGGAAQMAEIISATGMKKVRVQPALRRLCQRGHVAVSRHYKGHNLYSAA